jgi:hypothetical protein
MLPGVFLPHIPSLKEALCGAVPFSKLSLRQRLLPVCTIFLSAMRVRRLLHCQLQVLRML